MHAQAASNTRAVHVRYAYVEVAGQKQIWVQIWIRSVTAVFLVEDKRRLLVRSEPLFESTVLGSIAFWTVLLGVLAYQFATRSDQRSAIPWTVAGCANWSSCNGSSAPGKETSLTATVVSSWTSGSMKPRRPQ